MTQSNVLESQKSSTATPEKLEQPGVGNEHPASPSPIPETPENLLPTLNDEEQETVGQTVSDNDALSSSEPSPKKLTRKYVRVKIKNIIVPNERRKFDNAKASELKESIRLVGLINPITVRKAPKGYLLVTGARRLEAMILGS